MKLLTKAIAKQFPPLYSQENVADPVVQAKFFAPWGMPTWWAIEFDGTDRFFGFALLNDPTGAELGYFSLSELQSVKGPFGLGIERDTSFTPKPLSEAKKIAGWWKDQEPAIAGIQSFLAEG